MAGEWGENGVGERVYWARPALAALAGVEQLILAILAIWSIFDILPFWAYFGHSQRLETPLGRRPGLIMPRLCFYARPQNWLHYAPNYAFMPGGDGAYWRRP